MPTNFGGSETEILSIILFNTQIILAEKKLWVQEDLYTAQTSS